MIYLGNIPQSTKESIYALAVVVVGYDDEKE